MNTKINENIYEETLKKIDQIHIAKLALRVIKRMQEKEFGNEQ